VSNSVNILQNFKTNTDAFDVNKGFFYQYLVTVIDWLDNYLDGNDVDIYCETEDDIKAEDLKKNEVTFTQVKAYAKDFNLTSEEVQKSILNFFQLYIEYHDKGMKTEFIFFTSSGFNEDLFKKVSEGVRLNEPDKVTYVKKISSVLIDNFEKKQQKKVETLDEKIAKSEAYLLKTQIAKKHQVDKKKRMVLQLDNSTKEKVKIVADFEELKLIIRVNVSPFVDSIKWVADNKPKDDSINSLTESINAKISNIDGFKLDPNTAYAHLKEKVLIASQSINIDDRKLNKAVIDTLIEQAKDQDKFRNSLSSAKLLPLFYQLSKKHDLQLTILNEIKDDVKLLVANTDEFIKNQEKEKSCNPTPNCFTDFQKDAFDYTTSDVYKKLFRKVRDITPKEIFKAYQNKLFYPHKPNNDSAIEILEKRDVNQEIWKGWLELIVLLYLCNKEVSAIKKLILSKKEGEKCDVKIKLYFTQEKRYDDFIVELLEDDFEGIEHQSCLIFNSLNTLYPIVFPRIKINNILTDIYGSSSTIEELNPVEKKEFGMIHFAAIKNVIACANTEGEIVEEIKKIFTDAIN
jgi:hypothetical protein